MKLRYRIVNVFNSQCGRLSGNPRCVFEDGDGLDGETMQALARQFNLSETTFILPSSLATVRVRIFTPDFEMRFAGHPTLGTAYVVRALQPKAMDRVVLEMPAGLIPVQARGDLWTLTANAATHREIEMPVAELAAALALRVDDVVAEPGGRRPLWVDAGSEQLVVPLVDPATGSASANLGGWYLATGSPPPLVRRVHQGTRVGRPSELLLSIDGGGTVCVGGAVVALGAGEIER